MARPSKWGNPFKIGEPGIVDRAAAVARFEAMVASVRRLYPSDAEIRAELGGKDLACWCPLDEPCHADVLLKIANG